MDSLGRRLVSLNVILCPSTSPLESYELDPEVPIKITPRNEGKGLPTIARSSELRPVSTITWWQVHDFTVWNVGLWPALDDVLTVLELKGNNEIKTSFKEQHLILDGDIGNTDQVFIFIIIRIAPFAVKTLPLLDGASAKHIEYLAPNRPLRKFKNRL